jgi:hypothetical protein
MYYYISRLPQAGQHAIKVGISLPQAGQHATRENILQTAKSAESEGLDSLWVFEGLLVLNPQTPYGGTPDGSFPIEYQIMLDPLETLTYVVANTCNPGERLFWYRRSAV